MLPPGTVQRNPPPVKHHRPIRSLQLHRLTHRPDFGNSTVPHQNIIPVNTQPINPRLNEVSYILRHLCLQGCLGDLREFPGETEFVQFSVSGLPQDTPRPFRKRHTIITSSQHGYTCLTYPSIETLVAPETPTRESIIKVYELPQAN